MLSDTRYSEAVRMTSPLGLHVRNSASYHSVDIAFGELSFGMLSPLFVIVGPIIGIHARVDR